MVRPSLIQTCFSRFHHIGREFIRSDAVPAVFLLVLPLLVFWPATLGQQAYFHHDLQYYFYPYHKLVADLVADGSLPLWNPYAFGGMPLIADGQTALFYPPNLLFLLLPAERALTLVMLLHFGIAGVGTFVYARQLGLVRTAALIAALAYMFNGFLVSRVVHYSIMAGAALVPLLFAAVERLLRRPNGASFALVAALIGLQAVAGHPQVPVYTVVALGLYCTAVVVARRPRGLRSLVPLLLLAGACIAGYALAAVQLAPWIEWAAYSPRAASASYEFVTYHALRGYDWLLFLFPYGFGGLLENMMQTTPAWPLPVYMWERLGYVGLVPLGLAVVGLATGGRRARAGGGRAAEDVEERLRRERFVGLVVVLVGMLLIAAGSSTPVGRLVYLVPALGKLRAYSRAVVVAAFAIAMLAGYGAQHLATAPARGRVLRSAAVAGTLVFLAVDLTLLAANTLGPTWLAAHVDVPMWKQMWERNLQLGEANAYIPLALVLATSALLWLAAVRPRAALMPLLLLTAIDMILFALHFNPTTDPAGFARLPQSVAYLRADKTWYRTASFIREDRLPLAAAQSQLAISWAIPYAIRDINGFNSLESRRHLDLLIGPTAEDVSYGFLNDAEKLESDDPVLNLFGVKYVLIQRQTDVRPPQEADARMDPGAWPRWRRVYVDEHVMIYRNSDPLPRAFFAGAVRLEPSGPAVLDAVTASGFDPRRLSIVEQGITAAQAAALGGDGGAASVEVTVDRPNELRFRTRAPSDRLLVLSETWAPGWHAEVDGQAAPVLRANYLFRGVVVPAGAHEVRLVYRPTSLVLGAALSLAAAFLLGGLFLTQRGRRPGIRGQVASALHSDR